jgi:hypothetical protein
MLFTFPTYEFPDILALFLKGLSFPPLAPLLSVCVVTVSLSGHGCCFYPFTLKTGKEVGRDTPEDHRMVVCFSSLSVL